MSTEPASPPFQLPPAFADADLTWEDELTIQCKGVKLQLTRGFDLKDSTDDVVVLFKSPKFVRGYVENLEGVKVDNIVEVGIWDGGSAIFFWNLLQPRKLTCIELKESADALTRYIEREQLDDRFRVHFEVDQGDKAQVSALLDADFGDEALDVVIDDASHLYGPSRATFEAIFPRLRQGGLYFLEDWKASLLPSSFGIGEGTEEPPFHQLVHELLELSMLAPGVMPSVKCFHNFVVLERGPDAIPKEGFDICRWGKDA